MAALSRPNTTELTKLSFMVEPAFSTSSAAVAVVDFDSDVDVLADELPEASPLPPIFEDVEVVVWLSVSLSVVTEEEPVLASPPVLLLIDSSIGGTTHTDQFRLHHIARINPFCLSYS